MADPTQKYDLFVSYSHQQEDWVLTHLLNPLKACRTEDGRIPQIFYDRDSIYLGANWMEKIAESIVQSRKVLLLLSHEYDKSEVCRFEMLKAFQSDPAGLRQKVVPLKVQPDIQLHDAFTHVQALDITKPQWFDVLVEQIGWRRTTRVQMLRFLSPVPDATAGETLAEVRVALECEGVRVREDEVVTLVSEKNTLRGTTALRSSGGLAVFTDLLLETPVDATRLLATADGCTATFSEPFAVKERVAGPTDDPVVPAHGDTLFFAGSEAIAVVGDGAVRVFDLQGRARGEAAVPWPARFVRPCGGGLVFCSWRSEVTWVGPGGEHRHWTLPAAPPGFEIPGDVMAVGADLRLGLWSGHIYRLRADGSVEAEQHHRAGVQAMTADEDRLFLVDLDGELSAYRGAERATLGRLEPTIRLLKIFPKGLVAIGYRRIYQYAFDTRQLHSLPLEIRLQAALDGGDRLVAIDQSGKGILIDRQLTLNAFQASAGATPVSLDRSGTACVLRNPDRSYSLLHAGRIVFQHTGGSLSVSPSGEWFAVEKDRGIAVVAARRLLSTIGSVSGV